MRRRLGNAFCVLGFIALLPCFWDGEGGSGTVVLNEVMPVDVRVLMDEDGDYPGWVELLNTGQSVVDLKGYGLSDDPRQPFKWVFPSVRLAPEEILLVFTSGKDRRLMPGTQSVSTNATLSPSEVPGLTLWLDAADSASLVIIDGKVASWKDRSGRVPPRQSVTPATPNQLSGLRLWFDAADTNTIVLSDGRIETWKDKSGLDNHATQEKDTLRPLLATNDVNGLNVVRFVGGNQYLVFSPQEDLHTILWVGCEAADAPPAYRPLLGDGTAYDFHRGEDGRIYWSYGAVRAALGTAQTWVNGELVCPTMVRLPLGMALVTSLTDESLRASTLSVDRYLPGRAWWGDVAEVIAFDRVLSDSERKSLEAYLCAKWQLPYTRECDSYDAFQAAPQRRPEYKFEPLTGMPHVWFDGEDDGLEFPRLDNIRTVFFVIKGDPKTLPNYRPILGDTVHYDFHAGEDRLLFSIISASTNVLSGRCRVNGQDIQPVAAKLGPTWALVSLVTTAGCRANNLAWDRAMTDRCFAGGIAEFIVFDRELSETEVLGIESYLQQKWKLPLKALHASFTLGSEGGTLYLVSPDGQVVSQLTFPHMSVPCSYGRCSSGVGETLGVFDDPTPGAFNPLQGYVGICKEPVMAPEAGFYEGPVVVSLESTEFGNEYYYTLNGAEPSAPTIERKDEIWMDDVIPLGANAFVDGGDDWIWVRKPDPVSGSKVHRSLRNEGFHMHGFVGAEHPLKTTAGDILFVHVYLDPTAQPSEIMVQWNANGRWSRAFWGEDKLGYGGTNTPANYYAGPIPESGKWVRLEVPASALELEETAVTGMAFCLYGGAAWWDATGRSSINLSGSKRYTEPIVITNTTVVRFRAVAPGYLPSPVVTRTYLIDFAADVPVISIACNPNDLISERNGMLVPGSEASTLPPYYGANFWRRWERPVNAEFIDPASTNRFNQIVGLQVHGNYSRSAPQKSLELHARKRYGNGKIRCHIFPEIDLDEFDVLMLRNGGNDWNRALIRDCALQKLAQGLDLGLQAGRPAHVFLNGAYYGVLNLREFADENHVAAHFGVPKENIDMIFGEREVVAGDIVDYNNLVSFIKTNDLTDPSNYAVVTNWINIDNYIDYEICEIFCDNRDWPGNNVLCWRNRTSNGRWHWVLEDLDAAFDERGRGPANNTLIAAYWGLGYGTSEQAATIFRSLLKNPDFRSRFITRFTELLNTRFLPENVISIIDATESAIERAMELHINRWKNSGDYEWPSIQSMAEWRANVEHIRAFARARPEHVRNYLDLFFKLGGTVTVVLDVVPKTGGMICVDKLEIPGDATPWSGVFFREHPVTLQAVPQPGYKFAGWIGLGNTSDKVSLTLEDGALIAARFETDEEYDLDRVRPKPHDLRWSNYALTAFSPDTPAGTYPPSMLFYQTSQRDPGLDAPMESEWVLPYNRDSRSRIRGLGDLGFSFVNTSDPQPEPGAGFLGAAVLSLRTTGLTNIQVSWVGGTVVPNNRVYAIRLQYRVGLQADWRDVLDAEGRPVEYVRSEIVNDSRQIGPVTLPPEVNNQLLVQLRWKYYFIPTGASGPRAELRIDDITVMPTSGRRPLILLGCCQTHDGKFWAGYLGMPYETVELLVSGDLVTWAPIRVLSADSTGKLEFQDLILRGIKRRFYQLRRLY